MATRYDVFLSHASADKQAVERLARKLREEGLEPFLDTWFLVAGEPWQEALEEAVHQSSTCAVFFGPVSKGGAWRSQETQLALARAAQDATFRVIPVLLPQSKAEDVPGFLSLRTWVDFRNGLENADALARLISSIRGKAAGDGGGGERPSLPYRCMAPARELFIERSEYGKVRDALLHRRSGGEGSGQAMTVGITTAIHGAGGFGKSALAVELCYDPQVREQYPDGVLFTTMGEEIETAGRLARLRDLIRWWTEEDPPAFETVSAAGAHLRQELDSKRVLLVMDDVWRPEDVSPFQGLGPGAALLLTTRDSRTLPAETVSIHVDAMEVPEAVRLLGAGLPVETAVDLRELATRLGEWPLLLKIVHRQLRELIQKDGLSPELALREVEEALDAEGLTAFDREDLESRDQAVTKTVGVSLRRLSGEEIDRFEQLVIFPEDTDIPLPVLEKLWNVNAFATKKLCVRLYELSLLLRLDRQAGVIRLHDVIRGFLLKRRERDLPEIHRRLLEASRPASGRWADLPSEETYLWQHLIHHLLGAGERGTGRELLLDFHFVCSKIVTVDINALLADYGPFTEDEELRLVHEALRLSAHVLASQPDQLQGQLWGRLQDRAEPGIQSLLKQAGERGAAPWLRPRAASLPKPGGALIRTIYHPGQPSGVAALPDGRVVSGSKAGKLRIWDIESGKCLRILNGHTSWVSALAVLDDRRVVSGSNDRALRVWDIENGQTLHLLEGHSARISTVAALDSRQVISGSSDNTLRVWDVTSGRALRILEGHSAPVRAVGVLDSRRVVSGSNDRTLRVWDVESGETLQILEGHSAPINSVAVLDSRRVVSGSSDNTLLVWDVESGQILRVLEGHSDGVLAVAALDSRRVVSGSIDRSQRVWDTENGQVLQVLEGHSAAIRSIAILGGGLLASTSKDQTLRIWDIRSREPLALFQDHSAAIRGIAVFDSQKVVSGASDGTITVWDVNSAQALSVLIGIGPNSIEALAVLDQWVVCGDAEGSLWLLDIENKEVLSVIVSHSAGVGAIVVLETRRVIVGHTDGTMRVWDIEFATLEGHSDRIRALAALDGRWVVSGSEDGMLRVWDVDSRQEVIAIIGEDPASINALAVFGDGRVVASTDRKLRVWDTSSRQALAVLEGHTRKVNAAAVLDDRRVVSGSDDRTLRVWDVESRELECLFTLDAPVTAVTVLPGSRVIVAGDGSGRVHFFDLV
jgi:WD40 repeat protein